MRSKIIYEDESLIVVHKPSGLATQTSKLGQQDLVSEIKNYLSINSINPINKKQETGSKNKIGEPYVGLIHRLDQPVEGILVLAKNEFAAAQLSTQITKDEMKKCYYAFVYGKPKETNGIFEDYVLKDAKTNSSKVVSKNTKDRDVKRAELNYQCLKTVEKLPGISGEDVLLTASLMDIQLKTGRHHQIRVQFSHAGIPLLGDNKYGTAESIEASGKINLKNVALCAYRLEFIHPKTKKKMHIQIEPEAEIFRDLCLESITKKKKINN